MKIDQNWMCMCARTMVAVLSQQNGEEIRIPHVPKPFGSPPLDSGIRFLDEIIEENRANATLTGESLIFARRAPTEANRQESASHHIM